MESPSWKKVFMITMIIASFILSALTFLLLYTIIQKEKLFFLGDILNKSDDDNEYHLLEIGSGIMTGTFFLIALNLIFTTYKYTNLVSGDKNLDKFTDSKYYYKINYKKESTTRILHWSLLVLIVFLTTGIGLFAYDYFSTNDNLFGETNKIILLSIFSLSSLFLFLLILLFISLNISIRPSQKIVKPENSFPEKEYSIPEIDLESEADDLIKAKLKDPKIYNSYIRTIENNINDLSGLGYELLQSFEKTDVKSKIEQEQLVEYLSKDKNVQNILKDNKVQESLQDLFFVFDD